MKLVVEKQKILQYLLLPQNKADKSKFLNNIGYDFQNWKVLQKDLIKQFVKYPFQIYEKNQYGILYKIDGTLSAPKKDIEITTIWILQNKTDFLRLVTLFPKK